MITLDFLSWVFTFTITLPLLSLHIHIIENKLKKLKNLELSNQFEVRAFISSFEIFLHGFLLLIFIIGIAIFLLK